MFDLRPGLARKLRDLILHWAWAIVSDGDSRAEMFSLTLPLFDVVTGYRLILQHQTRRRLRCARCCPWSARCNCTSAPAGMIRWTPFWTKYPGLPPFCSGLVRGKRKSLQRAADARPAHDTSGHVRHTRTHPVKERTCGLPIIRPCCSDGAASCPHPPTRPFTK